MGVGVALIVVAIGGFTLLAFRGTQEPTWPGWFSIVVGLLVAFLAYNFSSLRVQAQETAVSIRFGPFGWPSRVIAYADIESADAIMVEPMRWGGWGYRWIPWAKASAAVIRKGPGIELLLKDGRRFAVTVEDAVTGAQTISAQLS
jgi:hypothetical protein